jgi:hypothetical protein
MFIGYRNGHSLFACFVCLAAAGCEGREHADWGELDTSETEIPDPGPYSPPDDRDAGTRSDAAYWFPAEYVPPSEDPEYDGGPYILCDEGGSSRAGIAGGRLRPLEECCADPADFALCWWQDAARDGVTCGLPGLEPCPRGNACVMRGYGPEGEGLCGCDGGGQCRDGYCTYRGHCGPSYCNGYKQCSCWGGCVEAGYGVSNAGVSFESPDESCASPAFGSLFCNEAEYPLAIDGSKGGHCADVPTC